MIQVEYNSFLIKGLSRASVQTFFYLPELKLGIDAGLEAAFNMGRANKLFISHLHPDHWSGLIQILFERYIQKRELTIMVHTAIESAMRKFLSAYKEVTGLQLLYDLQAFQPDQIYPLNSAYSFQLCPVVHSKSASGIIIIKNGIPWLGYTSDTSWQGLENNPIFFQCKVLLIECTYISEEHKPFSEDHAHIHICQIKDNIHRFENENIYLTHISPRYDQEAIQAELNAIFTKKERERFRVWQFQKSI